MEWTLNDTFFALPPSLSAKADAAQIAPDERHFAEIAATIAYSISELEERLSDLRRATAGPGSEAVERDNEIRRLSTRLRTFQRYGVESCLGSIVPADGSEPQYIGRFGLTDASGRRLLVDWRSPAAEPFFGATHAHPLGLASRRRYRWTPARGGGFAHSRVVDYWDEAFTTEGLTNTAALDDQSAFIASLGASRSPRMRDVLGTIQADQDAIIRSSARGALVVDGGPGTGKTVVALHRAAYLIYSDSRLSAGGEVLFVGPSPAYLGYVEDVLPSLGEDGVQVCTLRDLVLEGASASAEVDDAVARLKASVRMVRAIDGAVGLVERPPKRELVVETPWGDILITARDWAEAFDAVEPGTPHNLARDQVWRALVEIVGDRVSDGGDRDEVDDRDQFDAYGIVREAPDELAQVLAGDEALNRAFSRAWPLLAATDVVGQLWSSPALLEGVAPWLEPAEVAALQRRNPRAWTLSDLPLLDAARRRLGDPYEAATTRRREAAIAAERSRMADVVADLIAGDDSEMKVMSMLRGQDLRSALVDDAALPTSTPDRLEGPFGHIIVDEAQELTDAEWQMLLARCPSRSVTIVGDRAQARRGFTETWEERLSRVGFGEVAVASLTINYRTPAEVMAEAAEQISRAIPGANVPTSIRSTGLPIIRGEESELQSVLDEWVASHPEGTACVIGDPSFVARERVVSLTPSLAKGLEFDLVVVVNPSRFGEGITGAVDRYVAMSRATQQMAVLGA